MWWYLAFELSTASPGQGSHCRLRPRPKTVSIIWRWNAQWTPTRSPLLELPRELRDKVLGYVLPLGLHVDAWMSGEAGKDLASKAVISLKQTNQQLKKEAREISMFQTEVVVGSLTNLGAFIRAIPKPMRFKFWRAIRLDLSADKYIQLFGSSVSASTEMGSSVRSNAASMEAFWIAANRFSPASTPRAPPYRQARHHLGCTSTLLEIRVGCQVNRSKIQATS
ncbi:uncharacterized protein BDZ99DRAFT_468750 [Mytilinidion resinicola]|uniref:Uncharacterized protein n=1 Tax=Mytilinidion resinicola TaxID=574789 RepID=A0A6A6Y444_9PEZI|nr:uncharacterized protein BDZ99DRAFT_468750 [Mytilinidion resinicola]KAF2802794.1 hypothetical protein BDZ99DRAFT_468750 [Mytilinidion resinicola]